MIRFILRTMGTATELDQPKTNGASNHAADLTRLSAIEVAHLTKSNSITVEAYARSLLERISKRDPLINAWVHIDKEHVLKQARKLDSVPFEKRGRLHGVAVGIKDVALTKDSPTRYGSPIHKSDGCASADSAPVAILRAAGALIVGQTATTELAATSKGGVCANPHHLDHTPGGSSSGSAAAVADYHVPISLGTQTGGSMIRPGSFNGIYAYKPTWGLVSTEGLSHFSVTCDTPGVFARSLEDLDLLASVFQLYNDDALASTTSHIRDFRIAFVKTPFWSEAGPGTQAAWERAQALLYAQGAQIENVELPPAFEKSRSWREIVVANEAKSSFLSRYMQCKEKLDPDIVRMMENGGNHTREQILEAYDNIAALRPLWDQLADQYDAVITPSVIDEAPRGLKYTGSSCFCSMWTILHAPVLNVPGFYGELGLPIGLTVVGARYGDLRVLQAGRQIGAVFAAPARGSLADSVSDSYHG